MPSVVLPDAAIPAIVNDIHFFGEIGVETGAWLLASEDDPNRIRHVALLGDTGIVRRPDQLIVSGKAIAVLFDWAVMERLVVRAQVHSHGRKAFMSETDRRFGLTVEGFIAAIVPFARIASSRPDAWRWWVFRDGRWSSTDPAAVGDGEVRVVRFDEAGVHG